MSATVFTICFDEAEENCINKAHYSRVYEGLECVGLCIPSVMRGAVLGSPGKSGAVNYPSRWSRCSTQQLMTEVRRTLQYQGWRKQVPKLREGTGGTAKFSILTESFVLKFNGNFVTVNRKCVTETEN